MRRQKDVIPYFDRVQSVIALGTEDGCDHGWMLVIAHDPMAGRRNRYSVFQINCQTRKISTHGRELDLKFAKEIRDKLLAKLTAQGATGPFDTSKVE